MQIPVPELPTPELQVERVLKNDPPEAEMEIAQLPAIELLKAEAEIQDNISNLQEPPPALQPPMSSEKEDTAQYNPISVEHFQLKSQREGDKEAEKETTILRES